MSKEQFLGIKLDFHASSYTLGSFPQNNLKNDVQYVINQTFIPDRTSTNSNSGKGNYIASIEAFRIRSAALRNAQLLITNNFQLETTIEFTSEGLHYLYSDNTSSNVTHLNIRASTSLKTLEILYNTTLCMTFNYNFIINKKYNIVITYVNSRYYLMVNGIECGKSTISAAQNLNSLFQNASIYQCFYSYKYSTSSSNGFIGNVYDLICSFDSKYIHRSINGYSQVNNHLLSNLSYSTGLEIERKNEPSIVWSYENVSFAPNKITYDISPMSTNIPSKDFKIEFTISDIKLGIHNIAKIDNRYFIDYTVTGVLEPDVEVNDYTTSALNFENDLIDQIGTTIWQKEGTADVTSVNKIFGESSFETKALGDGLYTKSNVITGGSTPFTIEFYNVLNPNFSTTTNGTDLSLYAQPDSQGYYQGVFITKETRNIGYYRNGTMPNLVYTTLSSYKINVNDVNKYTITYDGAAIRLFVNDKLANIIGSGSGHIITNQPFQFLSYNFNTSKNTTSGLIDNINIHDGIATKVRDYDPYEEYLVVDLAFDGENNSTKIVDNARLKERNEIIYNDYVVSLLHFDDNIKDETNHIFTNSTSSTFKDDVFNKSLIFSGNHISTPYSADFDFGISDFTIELFTTFSSLPSNYVYSLAGTYLYDDGWVLQFRNDEGKGNRLRFAIGDLNYIDVDWTPIINKRYHIVASRYNGTISIFVDGNRLKQSILNNNIQAGSSNTFNIGALKYNSNVIHYFYGYIDEFRIIKGKAVYTENFTPTTEPFNYVKHNKWTVNGNAKLSTTQKFDGFSSVYLDGTNSYLTSTYNNYDIEDKDFTIKCSIRLSSIKNTDNVILDAMTNTSAIGWQLYVNSTGNLVFYDRATTINGSKIVLKSTKILAINTIYDFTITRENNSFKMYIDGILENTNSGYINFGTSTPINIGAQVNSRNTNYDFNGYIKDFKIYKGVAVIPERPVGKIQLDFDNNLNDKYNNSSWTNNGVAFDNVNSVKGHATYFDTSTDYLEANVNNSYLNYGLNDFNLSFDLKETNKSSNSEVFSNNIASTAAGSIWFYTGTTVSGFDYFSKPTGVTSNAQSSFANIYYNYKISRYKGVLLTIQNGVITTAQNVGNISFNLINGGSFRLGKPTTTFHSTVGGFIGYLDNFKSNSDHFYGKMWAMVIANVSVLNSPYDYNNTSLATFKTYFPGSIAHLKYSFSGTPTVTINDVANSYIIEENPLGKKFYIYAANGTYTNTEAQLFLEFLDADNNVIVAMKWFRDTTYSNMFTYGPTLSSQINTTKVGSYGITNGILEVNSNGLLFTNLSTATTNYIDNFSYAINLNNIKKYRISGMKAVGDYNPTLPGVRIQEVIDNGSFEPIVDKPAVHFPLETNATNIGFANLTVTSTGSPTYTNIDGRKCIKFESGKYLNITSNNIFNLSNNSDFYIELDFYLLTDKYHVLFSNASSSTSGLFTITAASSTHTQPNVIYIYQNNNTNIKTSNSWIMNSWNNLIISRNGGIITLILNGVVTTINSSVQLDYSTSGTRIGQPSYDANAFVDGYMSNFTMFIGSSKISETYNDKKVLDLDFAPTRESYMFKDKNNKCVLHPINIAQRDFKNSQYCCTFNGSDQYIELGKNDLFNFGLDDFIFEFKFTPVADGTWNILIGNGSTASDSNYSYIGISESTNATNPSKVYLTIGSNIISLISANQVSYNSINTLIVSKNNSDYQIILNGIVTTGNYTPTALNFNYNNSTRIGSTQVSNWVNHLFSGQIYSVKVLRNTTNADLLLDVSDSSFDISLYDSNTSEISNINVDKINTKNVIKRIGNQISYSSANEIISINAEEKTEETTDVVLFDTFKGSIKNDIKVYDGDYSVDTVEFVDNPMVYEYVDIEIAEDEYCDVRTFEIGDYIIKGFIEGYRNHDYQIIQTNNNFVVAYGNDDFYYEGIEKRFLNDYIVLDVNTGIKHKLYDRTMVRGQLTINIQQLACEGSDYVLKLYRKNDYFFIGEYEITGGICTIENLDCNTLYDCILFDRSGYYEGRTLSSRTPSPV